MAFLIVTIPNNCAGCAGCAGYFTLRGKKNLPIGSKTVHILHTLHIYNLLVTTQKEAENDSKNKKKLNTTSFT